MDFQEQKENQAKRVTAENAERSVNQASKEIQEQMDLREHLETKANEGIQALLVYRDPPVLEARMEPMVRRVKRVNRDKWARWDLREKAAPKGNVLICH
jgi:hypothetical protein